MGGTGKTTLAKEVGKELKKSEQFAYVVDTTVSFTPDIKEIQDDIAGSLGLEWEDRNESDRHKKLWSRLTNGDKILVILDDVWDRVPPLDFEAIGIPKRDNHKGCRVLVTSRSKITFNKMDCDKSIELDLLSKEDAWIMFKSYAGISDSSSKKLIDKGRKIANECKQLPVAISVIASSLKGQQNREHEWDVTLKSLKQPVSMHGVEDDMVGIYNCLKISYDNLKDEKAKGLFLLCSVFREDEEISIEALTRLCTGVGLLGEGYGSYDDARNQVVVAKNKLVDSCLLLEVGEKGLRMHDLVRDAAQWIANKEIQCVKLFDKNHKSSVGKQANIKYLSCEGKCMDLFSFNFDGSKLETLIVKVDRDDDRKCKEFPNSFFENVIKLRVFYFSNNNSQRSLSLPNSIRLLINIRSMSIDHVDLGDISILGNLQSLETLDLTYCEIKELPNQITKLSKFKLLKLKGCRIRMNNPFEVIERCSSLEELYFKDSFNDFCQEITLPELQRYHIRNYRTYPGMIHISTLYLDTTKFPKYLVFYGDKAHGFSEEALKYCMQTADALCLKGIKGEWRNLMPNIVSVELGMNDLFELHLGSISQLRCLIDTIGSGVPNVLSKLVVLELIEMENLEELFNGPISFESLNNLEKVSIKDCKRLRILFKGKRNLCNLKTITLENCPMLVSLFEVSTSRRREDEEIDDGDNNKIHGSMFSKLNVIEIEECHQLESILPFLSAQDLPVLEAIRIKDCDGLKYVFGQSQHVELVSLSELELFRLPNFIGIFEESNHLMSSCVKGSSSTSNYGSKAQIQLEPIKCNIFSCCQTRIPLVDVDEDQPHDYSVASESNSHCLNILERAQNLPIQIKILSCNTKKIELSSLPKIKSILFSLSVAPITLETLKICNCDELKHIMIDTGDHNTGGNNWVNVFPKVEVLEVKYCEQLEYIFGYDTNDQQNHMEVQLNFPELRELGLYGLPSLVAMCPKQYQTAFPSLAKLSLGSCYQFDIKSIFHSVSEFMDHTIIKELSGNVNVDHFLSLENLWVHRNSKVENIFSLNEIDGQQLELSLKFIVLCDLSMMTCLFLGPKNSFSLKNLTRITIMRCEKLKIAFSTSMLRFLPQLCYLTIEECKELEHIMEDDEDLEDKKNSTTCFPNLEELGVINCNKLKFVLPFSVCKELPKLRALLITKANELEEIFKSKDDQKVDIPNLNILAFHMLPSLSDAQGNQFQAVKNRVVKNCQQLTLTSASTTKTFREIAKLGHSSAGNEVYCNVVCLFEQLSSETNEDFGSEWDLASVESVENAGIEQPPSAETTEDFEWPSVENVSDLVLPSSLFNVSDFELPTNSKLEGSTSEKTAVAIVSTISTTVFKSKPFPNFTSPIGSMFPSMLFKGVLSQKVEDLAILPTNSDIQMKHTLETMHECVDNAPYLAILPTKTGELLNEQSMDQQHSLGETDTIVKLSQLDESTSEKTAVAIVSTISGTKNETPIQVVASKQKGIEIEGTSKTNNDQVSLNDDALVKVNSTVEEQFSKGDEIIVSKSKPSPNITSPIASQFPSMPSKGDPFLVKRELEQLVSKNHLDYENLSLLTDFLVKNPSVHLKDTSLPNRYKGCAYNLLAELLIFLETHSLLEVSGSCHSEFVELLQDARYFAFDREWLDGVERRALFPETQVSPDALEKLLDSKKRVTKDVEDLRFKIHILSQHVEDLKHQLISSEAVLESIIEQEAVLSAPIGY